MWYMSQTTEVFYVTDSDNVRGKIYTKNLRKNNKEQANRDWPCTSSVQQIQQEKKGPPPFQLPSVGPLGSGTAPQKINKTQKEIPQLSKAQKEILQSSPNLG